MEETAFKQILKVTNPVIGIQWTNGVENSQNINVIITTTSEIYVYSPIQQECINQWSFSTDSTKQISIPTVQNQYSKYFFTVQASKTLYIWNDKMDSISLWRKINITDPIFSLISDNFFYDHIFIITKSGKLSLLDHKTPESSKFQLNDVEIVNYSYILLDKKTFYLVLLCKEKKNYVIKPILITKDSSNQYMYTPLQSRSLYTPESTVPCSLSLYPFLNVLCVLYSNGEMNSYTYYYDRNDINSYDLKQEVINKSVFIEGIQNVCDNLPTKKQRKSKTVKTTPFTCDIIPINNTYLMISSKKENKYLQLWDIKYGILSQVIPSSNPAIFISYCKENNTFVTVSSHSDIEQQTYYIVDSINLQIKESTLASAIESKTATIKSSSFPHVLTLSNTFDNFTVGYNTSDIWKNELQREIDNENEEYKNIYLDIMNKKEMTDAEFEEKLIKYLSYQQSVHTKLSKILLSQAFTVQCVNRCFANNSCLYKALYQLLYTCQVSVASYPDLIPILCEKTDLIMIEQAIKYIRDISEKEIIYILKYFIFKCTDADILNYFKTKEIQVDETKPVENQKLMLYTFLPMLISKRFNSKFLTQYLSEMDVKIVFLLLNLLALILFDYDQSNHIISNVSSLTLSQIYDWIICILDSHLYDIIFLAQKNTSLKKLLINIDDCLDKYENLGDTCYNIRAILTHIEDKIPLPVAAIPVYSIEEIPL